MVPIELTVDDIDREALEAARKRDPADRFRDGLQLFDRVCAVMAAGIRTERPDATDAEVLQILRARLKLARSLETS
jgi:hypothetical protein